MKLINSVTQPFEHKVNHMAWAGGEDMCFYISTEKRSCSCVDAAVQPDYFRGRGIASI